MKILAPAERLKAKNSRSDGRAEPAQRKQRIGIKLQRAVQIWIIAVQIWIMKARKINAFGIGGSSDLRR